LPSFLPVLGPGARADVAKTIYYRRRKGTVPMLEELARDVTGWPAHVVEFLALLAWTQWVRNHVRPQALATPDLRKVEPLDRAGGAFDPHLRTLDVRPMARRQGWHGVRKVGVFLWRLTAHRLVGVDARAAAGPGNHRFHASPLGQDAPLFSARRREADETGLAAREHVPQPISRALFHADLAAAHAQAPVPDFTQYYGLLAPAPGMVMADGRSFLIALDGVAVPPARIRCRNLDSWAQPAGDLVAVDVATGRVSLGPAVAGQRVTVSYHAGFPGDLGGGPYARSAWLTAPRAGVLMLRVDGSGAAGSHGTIGSALAAWVAAGRPDCIIRLADSRTYAEALAIEPADGRFLAIEAEDGVRPHLRLAGPLRIDGLHDEAAITLGGLLIEGTIAIRGSLGRLRLVHSTLVPGGSLALPPAPPAQSIRAAATRPDGAPANAALVVEAAFSVMGGIALPAHARRLLLLDCAVDAAGGQAIGGTSAGTAGPPARIERSTLRGSVFVRQLDLATEAIFDGPLSVERQQLGCIRFSWTRAAAVTPRRYRCQPDLAIAAALEAAGPALLPAQAAAVRAAVVARVRPEYTSEAYGQPAWLQLHENGPAEIAEGAEDGSEMGVWSHLKQPQREANLRQRLAEYLPFGLSAGLIHVT
ncbi:MAG: hypothetical protein SNJ63_10055, partial [Sphingomonadaceae bacterium]